MLIWLSAHAVAIPRPFFMTLRHDRMVPPQVTILLTSCVPSDAMEAMALHFEIFLCVVFYALPIGVMGYAYAAVAVCLWSSSKTGILTGRGYNFMSVVLVKDGHFDR